MTHHGWAIRLGWTSHDKRLFDLNRSGFTGHGLAGILMFEVAHTNQQGIRTKVFRTRKQARSALRNMTIKTTWPRAKVVAVRVEITERRAR